MILDVRLIRLHSSFQPDLLVCIPHAGAGISSFLNWSQRLNDLASLALVQLPGREDRLNEIFSESLDEISLQIANQVSLTSAKKIFIFGHSMGASIAWSVASQLWRTHAIKPIVILSAQSPHKFSFESNLYSSDLHQWFSLLGEDFPKTLENSELLNIFQTTFLADCDWLKRELVGQPLEPIPIDLHCLYALQDGLVNREKIAAWEKQTLGLFTVTPMQGGHLYFLKNPEELLIFIRNIIESYSHHDD